MRNSIDYIIFPLDVPSVSTAKEWVERLAESVGIFKIGLELFIEAGPEIVRFVREEAKRKVFLDLKLHDIPATVGRAMSRIADLDVTFATVHCGESPAMLQAAVDGSGGKVGVLGVTVLTSVSAEDIRRSGFRPELADDMAELAEMRAAMAKEAGCAGIVCSGKEVRRIKARFGDTFIAVTPGIRPAWDVVGADDQKRIVTPAQAVEDGADYLVIGRPIRDAKEPAVAARRIAEEVAAVL